MKSPKCLLVALVCLAIPFVVQAEDKNGLRVDVGKKALDRNDGRNSWMREVDRSMELKAAIRNISMKEMPEGQVECVILVRRWALLEESKVERYTTTHPLGALRPSDETKVSLGEYHIGGHMHGTSDRHVDQLAGWKLTITQGGQVTEFVSTSSFETQNKRAEPAK